MKIESDELIERKKQYEQNRLQIDCVKNEMQLEFNPHINLVIPLSTFVKRLDFGFEHLYFGVETD